MFKEIRKQNFYIRIMKYKNLNLSENGEKKKMYLHKRKSRTTRMFYKKFYIKNHVWMYWYHSGVYLKNIYKVLL